MCCIVGIWLMTLNPATLLRCRLRLVEQLPQRQLRHAQPSAKLYGWNLSTPRSAISCVATQTKDHTGLRDRVGLDFQLGIFASAHGAISLVCRIIVLRGPFPPTS